MVPDPQRTRRTFVNELWRAGSSGILETAGTTFLLLIVLRHFEGGTLSKTLVAASGSLGLLVSPVVVSRVTALGWPTAVAAARILCFGMACFLIAALWPVLPVFVVATALGMATSAAVIPLLTQIYQENYPQSGRGRLFSRTVMVRILTAALFAYVAGRALKDRLEDFPWLLLVFAGALGLASICMYRCPSRPLHDDGGAHPLRALRLARTDRLFGQTLLSWMLLGFANLMMLPMRVEYLANPKYELAFTTDKVALLTAVIPSVARLLSSGFWGYLFDRMNFFLLRSLLNLGFIAGILIFFMSDTLMGLVLGAAVFGISNAGGEVAWSLWVTKLAEPERVADYMSVHTFLTGVRGVLAPACGFFLARFIGLDHLAQGAAAVMLLGTCILVPAIWGSKK